MNHNQTIADLRERAASLRRSAQYADRSRDMQRDLDAARKLEAQAKRLEQAAARRKALLAMVHQGAKALFGADEDARRAWQQARTGHASCADMTDAQLDALIKELRRKKALQPRKHSANPQVGKIRALWADLHRQGIVRVGTDQALGKFCYRVTGTHSPDWLSQDDAGKVIEALKAMRDREAG